MYEQFNSSHQSIQELALQVLIGYHHSALKPIGNAYPAQDLLVTTNLKVDTRKLQTHFGCASQKELGEKLRLSQASISRAKNHAETADDIRKTYMLLLQEFPSQMSALINALNAINDRKE